MSEQAKIRWPEYYQPQKCPVHVRNELDIAATPDQVWAWLVRAPLWPSWYVNSANLRILQGPGVELKAGSRFRWRTFGVTITSTVLEYVPNERLAWDAKCFGVDAYHAWLLQPSAKGCYVLTEETQYGWLARLSQFFLPKRMSKYHQIWLEGLENQTRLGIPGTDSVGY